MPVREQSAAGVASGGDAMLTEQQSKAEAFRSWHIRGNPIVLFNAWDAGSAKAIAAGGSKAIATSSWAVANANGFSDGERTPLALAIDNLRRITGAVDVPVTVDLESGYGDTAEIVGTTIRLATEAGAIGCNLEDSFPVNGKLRNMEDHADRLRQARRVADQTTIGFFINARTDVFFQRSPEQHDQSMVQEAIDRARAYAQVGADGLFAPGLTNIALIERLAAESPLPLNVMVVETTPISSCPGRARGSENQLWPAILFVAHESSRRRSTCGHDLMSVCTTPRYARLAQPFDKAHPYRSDYTDHFGTAHDRTVDFSDTTGTPHA